MNVTLKHIKAFITIAETGSFADASTLLHCSQPALSVTIKNLEQEVGGKLFSRTTRSLALTPEGEAFLPVAQRLMADWGHALDDLKKYFTLQVGKLSVAAIPSFACNQLPDVLMLFRDKYPGIHVSVDDVITEDVVELVRHDRVEVGITFDPGPINGLVFTPIHEDRFLALLPAKHELSHETQIKWEDLLENDLITLQKPSSVRNLIDSQLNDLGLNNQPSFEAHQLATIGRLVASGLGVSIVPSLCARQMEGLGAVCKPLVLPHIIRKIGIVTNQRSPGSVASRELIKLLKESQFDWGYVYSTKKR